VLVLVGSSRSGAWPGPKSVCCANSGLGLARLKMKHAHSSNRKLHPAVMIVKVYGSKIAHPSSQRLPDPWGADLARGYGNGPAACLDQPGAPGLDPARFISTVTLKVLAAWPLGAIQAALGAAAAPARATRTGGGGRCQCRAAGPEGGRVGCQCAATPSVPWWVPPGSAIDHY
jgi:hypothetical protein